MTKLKYIGQQEIPSWMEAMDGRLWTILSTDDKEVIPYIGSTRTLEGLLQLGIVGGLTLTDTEEEIDPKDLERRYSLFCTYATEDNYRKCIFGTVKFSLMGREAA